jgi:hypothetical protein
MLCGSEVFLLFNDPAVTRVDIFDVFVNLLFPNEAVFNFRLLSFALSRWWCKFYEVCCIPNHIAKRLDHSFDRWASPVYVNLLGLSAKSCTRKRL